MADISEILGGTKNGLASLPWNEYREFPALNPSTIVHGVKSMKHLRYAWDHGRPDSEQMLWGRAVHCLLFEPREFESRYRAWNGSKRGNDYKEFIADAWEDDVEVLSAVGKFSMESALEAARGFVHDPLVKRLIAAGKPEVTVFATEGNIQCRGRLDWISTSAGRITDLKTARDIEPRAFARDFYKYHYDIKLGLYQRWVVRATGTPWPVEIVAMENSPPYDIDVIPIPDAVLDRGARKGLEIIGRVEQCIHTGVWPGISNGGYGHLETPTWEMDEETVEFNEEDNEQ